MKPSSLNQHATTAPQSRPSSIRSVTDLQGAVGNILGTSETHTLTQKLIDTFGGIVGDEQWIHTDPARAAFESPFGATIAQGHLLLAMLPKLLDEAMDTSWTNMRVNYGLDRVRFISPVPVGSAISARFKLVSATSDSDGLRTKIEATLRIPGNDRPACIAELIHIWKG